MCIRGQISNKAKIAIVLIGNLNTKNKAAKIATTPKQIIIFLTEKTLLLIVWLFSECSINTSSLYTVQHGLLKSYEEEI